VRSRDLNISASADFTSRDVKSKNDAVSPLFSDHVRALAANVYVNLLDSWSGYSTLSVTLTHGLGIFGATSSSDINKSTVGASGDYWRGNLEISRHQTLTDRLGLVVGAAGQTSFGAPLLSSEQFTLGGYSYGRAFDPSEVSGDSALAGKAELQYDVDAQYPYVSGIQPYIFYEGGVVWAAKPLPGTPHNETLLSVGAGVRFTLADRLHADISWAQPFEHDTSSAGARDSRVFFSINTTL
jgi:hemolysin activation/secretion protein